MKTKILILSLFVIMSAFISNAFAETSAKARVTILIASNQGNDFNLDNDAFRDQLIKLFAYTSYNQVSAQAAELKGGAESNLTLPDGYELLLNLEGLEGDRARVHAVIRKEGQPYVDTVLSVAKEGVVFLGGPAASGGDLVIVLEMSF